MGSENARPCRRFLRSQLGPKLVDHAKILADLLFALVAIECVCAVCRCKIRSWYAWMGILERILHLHTRSEEHTSELQSRENFVCRLLLEKKKMKNGAAQIR